MVNRHIKRKPQAAPKLLLFRRNAASFPAVMPLKKSPEQATQEVFDILLRRGQEEYLGEPVSQIEHACQSAQLARGDPVAASTWHEYTSKTQESANDTNNAWIL